jgi:hypothetical protein
MKVLSKNLSITQGLLDKLNELFPDTLPADSNVNIEQIRYLQGQRSVIQKLEELFNDIYED